MPANTAAALLTNGYRARLGTLRDTTADATAGLLSGVNLNNRPTQLAADLRRFSDRARSVISVSQESSGLLTLRYLSAYMLASGSDLDDEGLEPAAPTEDPLTVVRSALLWRLGQQAGRAVAITSATAVAARVARSSVQGTAVSTLGAGISRSPNISGYRRVTSSSCCERCADSESEGVYGDGEEFYQHPADRCTQEPVVAGVAETVLRDAPQAVTP